MSSSSSPSLYRALLARSLHHLRCGMLSPTVALQLCNSTLLLFQCPLNYDTVPAADDFALAAAFTSRFSAMHVPLLFPGQAASILNISSRNGGDDADHNNIIDNDVNADGADDWWLTLSGAAIHGPLLAATLRRLQTCRTALTTPNLARAVRASICASVFNSSVFVTSSSSSRGGGGGVKQKKLQIFFNLLVEELSQRLEVLSLRGQQMQQQQQQVLYVPLEKNPAALAEDSGTAVEVARLLSLSAGAGLLPVKLVTAILSFLDDTLPRLSAGQKERVASESERWWSSILSQSAAAATVDSPQLDLAIATELRDASSAAKSSSTGSESARGGAATRLRSQLDAAQKALLNGSDTKLESLERRSRFIFATMSLPVTSPADNFLLLRCVVLLTSWSKVLPLTNQERERLRPVLASPNFGSRLAAASNNQGAAVVLQALL